MSIRIGRYDPEAFNSLRITSPSRDRRVSRQAFSSADQEPVTFTSSALEILIAQVKFVVLKVIPKTIYFKEKLGMIDPNLCLGKTEKYIKLAFVGVIGTGLIFFEQYKIHKELATKKRRLTEIQDVYSRNILSNEIRHLENKINQDSLNNKMAMISSVALVGAQIVGILPNKPVWLHVGFATIGVAVIFASKDIKLLYDDYKKMQDIKNEIIHCTNAIKRLGRNDVVIKKLYQQRIVSLKISINETLKFNVIKNTLSLVNNATTIVFGIVTLVGAPYLTLPILICRVSVFVISSGINLYRLVKPFEKTDFKIKIVNSETTQVVRTILNEDDIIALINELFKTSLRREEASDGRLSINMLRREIGLKFGIDETNIDAEQVLKWAQGLIY